MAANVLSTQYVDIIQRGLEETLAGLRRLQGQADTSGASVRKLKDDIRNVGGSQAGSGGGIAGALGLGGLGKAAASIAGATAALTPLVALVSQGFGGTTELEQFGRAMTQVAQEAAALFAPALRLGTEVLQGMVSAFRETGVAGQLLLGRLSPLGMALEVLANPAVQGAMRMLGSAFGELLKELQPLINLAANVGTELLKAFVVEPLVGFVKTLTFAVLLMKELVRAAAPLFGGFKGKWFDAPDGNRRQVTLNQTGTEDANGTFQRIQQAVLRASTGDKTEEEKQTSELTELNNKAKEIANKLDAAIGGISGVISAVLGLGNRPSEMAEGTKVGLNVLGGLLLGRK